MGDIQGCVLRPHVVGFAIVLYSAAIGGEAIEEVVAEHERCLAAENVVNLGDELVVVADITQRGEEVISSRGRDGRQRIEIQRALRERSNASGRNHVVSK